MRTIIGTTKIADFPNALIKFRTVTPDESGRDLSNVFDTEGEARTDFDELKIQTGDCHLFICLLENNADQDAIDEELIDSFYEEDAEVA